MYGEDWTGEEFACRLAPEPPREIVSTASVAPISGAERMITINGVRQNWTEKAARAFNADIYARAKAQTDALNAKNGPSIGRANAVFQFVADSCAVGNLSSFYLTDLRFSPIAPAQWVVADLWDRFSGCSFNRKNPTGARGAYRFASTDYSHIYVGGAELDVVVRQLAEARTARPPPSFESEIPIEFLRRAVADLNGAPPQALTIARILATYEQHPNVEKRADVLRKRLDLDLAIRIAAGMA